MIEIYVDGSAKGNGKENSKGGFGVIIFHKKNKIIAYSEQHQNVTNNQMELKAILYAFKIAKDHSDKQYIIYSDSMYCVNICNKWVYYWARNNWKKKDNTIIENKELIKELYSYLTIDFFNAEVVHCGGHKGLLGNELADALATNNLKKFNEIVKEKEIIVLENNIMTVENTIELI